MNNRESIILQQLKRAHMAGNKPFTMNQEEIVESVTNLSELLKSIKTEELTVAYSNAIIDCRYAVPNVKEVLQGHQKAMANQFNANDWRNSNQNESFKPSGITRNEVQFTTQLIIKYPQFREVLERMSQGDQNLPADRRDHVEVCELIAGMFDGR